MKKLTVKFQNTKLQGQHINTKHSTVLNEIFHRTYPEYKNISFSKKEELNQSTFDYFFNEEEMQFYKIETLTNIITACTLKGYKVLIEENNLNSFGEFDKYMGVKKEKSFENLSQKLSAKEVLSDDEKRKIMGGLTHKNKESSILRYNPKRKSA